MNSTFVTLASAWVIVGLIVVVCLEYKLQQTEKIGTTLVNDEGETWLVTKKWYVFAQCLTIILWPVAMYIYIKTWIESSRD